MDLFTTTWRDYWQGVESAEPVGAIFTKPEIASLILDLAEYVPSRRLLDARLLEPSCGDGAFLREIVQRLVASETASVGEIDWTDRRLDRAVRAADISESSVGAARDLASELLASAGCDSSRATEIASAWILHADFLLHDWSDAFDFVVGNPPYVRIEELPKRVLTRYRELYETTSDRADIYVAFIQRGLELLSPAGTLAYICANRFTKNKYGGALRRLIASKYRVRQFINLEHTQPFVSDVSAYPAIFVMDRQHGASTHAATLADIQPETLRTVRAEAVDDRRTPAILSHFARWYPRGEPWTATSSEEQTSLHLLTENLPALEDSAPGTKVGIGVATGADRCFVLQGKSEQIESSRQLPLIMSRDVANAGLSWSGRYLVNPFRDEDDGELVDLRVYPGLAEHLAQHASVLRGRHVGRTRPESWFRTIDRIWPKLRNVPKLLIPDIQVGCVIGEDEGAFYPHHNLYWITSTTWPLAALKTLLRSSSVTQQVRALSVQMRGGSLRYQAQTLRRLRLPSIYSLSDALLSRLASLATASNLEEIDQLGSEAFRNSSRKLAVG
jgi:adenine-specific DNA-methyltransferase